jgi:multidrug efflux pump subunit AcrB
VDERAAGRAGLTVEDIKEEIENDLAGEVASEIQEGEKLIGIRVRLPDAYRQKPEYLKASRIYSPNGGTYLLGDLASVSIDPGQSEVTRENLKQMVGVTARLAGRDLGSTVKDIQKRLAENMVLHQGVTLQYGGEFETQQEGFRGLLIVLGAASLLVFIVLVIEFESFLVTGVIYLLTLLSLFGVFFALWVTNVTFNISSFVGTILIIGAVAENSIFFVHYLREHLKTGQTMTDAIIDAATVRLRPIIMTALAAILTLLPLGLGLGAGAQMQQPLAIAVIGGFTMSTLLILFVLPIFLSFLKPPR